MKGGKSLKRGDDPFVPFFSLFFFGFQRQKFVLGLPNRKTFYQEKAFHAGKIITKNDFTPQKKFPVTPMVVENSLRRTVHL